MVVAAWGYLVKIVMADTACIKRKCIIRQFEGEVILFVANGLRCSHDHIFDKWANRGDSALLDYLKPVE